MWVETCCHIVQRFNSCVDGNYVQNLSYMFLLYIKTKTNKDRDTRIHAGLYNICGLYIDSVLVYSETHKKQNRCSEKRIMNGVFKQFQILVPPANE
jgi:hypothetical protein